MRATTVTSSSKSLDQLGMSLQRHWLLALNVALGVWVLMPFSAPILMKLGLPGAAGLVYAFYGLQCHQLPERSYFLFGQSLTYSLDAINAARGSASTNLWTLRQFIGTDQLGYKVAWSDRMISLYTSIFVGAVIFAIFRRRARPLPLALAIVLLIPLGLDGFSHMVSDFAGLGQGFRDTNDWLRPFTANLFPDSFYIGDGWGSFNSLMRLATGILAGLAAAWLVLPRVDRAAFPRPC